MSGRIQGRGKQDPRYRAEYSRLYLSRQRLAAEEVWVPKRQLAVVQRRRLHFEPRQHLMPDIGTLYECVLRGECNLPERDDQTDRTQRYRQQRTGFDRQLPNGWLTHWMKLHH